MAAFATLDSPRDMGEAFSRSSFSAFRDPVATRSEPVQVFLLGSFRLFVHGRQIPEGAWRRRKARQLFKCLLSRPQRRLVKDEAIEFFWPDSSQNAASTNLRTTVYALCQTLQPLGDQIIIEDRTGYALGPDSEVWTDADAFEATIE